MTATQATVNAYAHPKLNELFQAAASTPFIGQVLIATVRDLVHPQDRIITCYYQIETSAGGPEQLAYYSIDVVLVTTAFFIRINFYPKTHTCIKKRIHSISDLKLEYPAPPIEALTELEGQSYLPERMALAVTFQTDKGTPVETWQASASDEERVLQLLDISRILGRYVGMPLQQTAPQK